MSQTKNDEMLSKVVMGWQNTPRHEIMLQESCRTTYPYVMPKQKEKHIYVRGKVTSDQKRAVSKQCQDENRNESLFVVNCIKEHFKRLSIAWPVSEDDSASQK